MSNINDFITTFHIVRRDNTINSKKLQEYFMFVMLLVKFG